MILAFAVLSRGSCCSCTVSCGVAFRVTASLPFLRRGFHRAAAATDRGNRPLPFHQAARYRLATVTPRLTTRKAAEFLAVSPHTIRKYVHLGWLSAVTNSGGRGPGQRYYLNAAEVDAFARGGAPAAEAYRLQRDNRPIVPRKGRGRSVV